MKFLNQRLKESIKEKKEIQFLNQYYKLVWDIEIPEKQIDSIMDHYNSLRINGTKEYHAKYISIKKHLKKQNMIHKNYKRKFEKTLKTNNY